MESLQDDISRCANSTPHPAMYYMYVLKDTKTRDLYYGYTNNLERRVAEHRKERSCELVYYEAYAAESDARDRERRLKNYAQALTALKGRLKESLRLGVGFNSANDLRRPSGLRKPWPH